jgi:hypothetical protein
MASLSLGEESSEQVVERLTRELENVSSQCRTSHRMFVYYKAEWEKSERLKGRVERSLESLKHRLRELPKGQKPTDSELDLWAAEGETTDANTRDEYGSV